MYEDIPAEKESSNSIEREDILRAQQFLKDTYNKELRENGKVTPELVKENTDHAERVAENARWIAENEFLDINKLELAAICHDCGKLRSAHPGGIDTFEHHITGARMTYEFLRDLGKSPALSEEIRDMIMAHSAIPFIKRWADENEVGLPEPTTPEEFALRDADLLDQIDIWGFKKIIEIRQMPDGDFYAQDGGNIRKAMASAEQSAKEAKEQLHTETAKKIAASYEKRWQKLVDALRDAEVTSIEEFREVFQKILSQSLDKN
ncbi:MAG: HD domain-containing protein [bacterium]|nr:HD domain-containing protein [bacterium]